MLEAEHPVPEAWVWRSEPAEQEGREEATEGRGSGRRWLGCGPAAREAAHRLDLLLLLQGGHRGHAGQGQDPAPSALSSSVVPCVLVQGGLLSPSHGPWCAGPGFLVHPQGKPGAEIQVQKE